jgi:PAS domain S-box-containing protein
MTSRGLRRSFLIPAAALGAFALGVGGVTLLHLRSFSRELRANVERELSSVADLKVAQLGEWRRQLVEDGRALGAQPARVQALVRLASGGAAAGDLADLSASLDARLRRNGLSAWVVVDVRGQVLLADPAHPGFHFAPEVLQRAATLAGPEVLGMPGDGGAFALGVPVRAAGGEPVAAAVFGGRASGALSSFVRAWPSLSHSAEAFLGVIEGEEILIEPLRHVSGEPFPARLRLDGGMPMAQAARGEEGVGPDRDYRGVAVLAARRRVAGLPWALVVKVDEAEVLAPAGERTRTLSYGLAALFLMAFGALWVWWRGELEDLARREQDVEDRKVRQRLEYLWAHSNDIVVIADLEGRILDVNDRAVEAYGYPRDVLRGLGVDDLRAPDAEADLPRQRRVLTEQGWARFETVHRRRDGTTFPVEESTRAFDADGRTLLYATFRDVSERKALERASRMQASLLANLNDAVIAVDRERRVTAWTGAAERVYGFGRAEVLGRPFDEVVRSSAAAAGCEVMAERAEREGVAHLDCRHARKDGTLIEVEISFVPLRDEGAHGVGTLLVARDVSERHRTEAALRMNEERLRLALDVAAVGTCDFDVPARRALLSEGLARLLGVPGQIDFEALARLFQPEDAAQVRTAFSDLFAGKLERLESEHRATAPGGPLWLRIYARAVERGEGGRARRAIATVADITRERRLQAQLVFSDRLASIGTLAAGVAHEINNPLSYLLANCEFLEGRLAARETLGGDPEALQAVGEARDGARRIAEIVRGLRTFSRQERDTEHVAVLDLRSPVTAAARIAENVVRPHARLVVELQPAPPVAATEHELAQVALNLIVNGAQAIAEGQPESNTVRVATGTAPDGRAFLEVRDTGAGIDPKHLARIFDPFFTTKAVGEGSGLGLAICHGIVEGLGGTIEVTSAPGEGSTFRVLLPPTAAVPLPQKAPARPTSHRRGRVMVIDDEAMVCRAVARTLGLEHEVIALSDPAEAMARLSAGERVDLVLCDLMMPGLTGMQCHEALSQTRPELAQTMTFLTGGAFTASAREFLERVPNRRIEKPFDAEVLRRAVTEGIAGR